jgi:hypothetical protein
LCVEVAGPDGDLFPSLSSASIWHSTNISFAKCRPALALGKALIC